MSQPARRLAVLFWVALTGLSAIAGAVAEEAYRTYRNERFGISADVPRNWKAGRSPENGDGLKFMSPDGAATITISGGLNISESVAEAMEAELTPDDGETVTYRHQADRTTVLSGTRGATIFYRKAILSCKDEVMGRISIDYPLRRKQEFDALVIHVAGSLRGGPGAQVGSCK